MLYRKKLFFWGTTFIILYHLAGCGTLGGIGYGVRFPTSKSILEKAMTTLFLEHPEYKMPSQWKQFDTWSARGYDFLEGRIFYFNEPPKEMYYVTFIGDSAKLADTSMIVIGIRAVSFGASRWYLGDDLKEEEKDRIETRFYNKIITKLEKYTHMKAHKLSFWESNF